MARTYIVGTGEETRMVCAGCGQALPMPHGLLRWCSAVAKAFEDAHRRCRKGDEPGRTRLAGLAVETREVP